MMDPDTDELLREASSGDHAAMEQLLARHRDRLRRMVRLRIDARVAARVDPSDVVQEAISDAWRKLPGYLRRRPVPFYRGCGSSRGNGLSICTADTSTRRGEPSNAKRAGPWRCPTSRRRNWRIGW